MREPNENDLNKIRHWPAGDLHGLMDYIREIWAYDYFERVGDEYHISTAGWSDNEAIIEAMTLNHIWWALNWYSVTSGGHYVFKRTVSDGNILWSNRISRH